MKIVVVGSGNAGVWSALHYGYLTRKFKNIEVELIHDPEIETFPVGQATALEVMPLLRYAAGVDWYSNEIRATPKLGILYENFRKENIYHAFPFGDIAIQADPKYLQRYILNSEWFSVKEGNVESLDEVDADVIFDCRGNTKKDDIEYESLYCPVNSVLLAVGPSPEIPQLWSRHVATPDGWTFVIPNTTQTTSYGYLYNSDITPIDAAKANFIEMFPEAKGSYSQHFEHKDEIVNLPFESYVAKFPIRVDSSGRKIILNGNRLGFLEPMESTAIGIYLGVCKQVFTWITGEVTKVDLILSAEAELPLDTFRIKNITANIKNNFHDVHTFVLWHYIKGSVYDTPFWQKAQRETTTIFEQPNEEFDKWVNLAKSLSETECREHPHVNRGTPLEAYGHWGLGSIKLWYDRYING